MISKRYFVKKQNMDDIIRRYNVYAINSDVKKNVVYAADKNKFALFTADGYAFCPIHEMPMMAKMLKNQKMAKEVIEIYEDIKYLKNMRIDYESTCS